MTRLGLKLLEKACVLEKAEFEGAMTFWESVFTKSGAESQLKGLGLVPAGLAKTLP
jgi:hypothetical protein